MLILQIALGIVLAVILLALIPQILSMVLWIGIASVAVVIVALAALLVGEFLSVVLFFLVLIYLALLFYSATKWKSILRDKKIEELKSEIDKLQQMLSMVELEDGDGNHLKATLKSRQKIRVEIKNKQAQLERLTVAA